MPKITSRKNSAGEGVAQNKRDDRSKSYSRRRRMMVLRRTLGTILLVVVGAGSWFAWEKGYVEQAESQINALVDRVPQVEALKVQTIDVDGGPHLSAADIQTLTAGIKGTPILDVPLDELRAKAMNMGWVADASVMRVLPATIRIQITERKPFAIWQQDGVLRLIDRQGHEITRTQVDGYGHLPLIVGQGAPAHLAELLALLERDRILSDRIHAYVRVADRRWDLRFDNGVEVMLPAENTYAALLRLSEMERTNAILSRDIAVLDLRLADRMTVRPRVASDGLTPASHESL